MKKYILIFIITLNILVESTIVVCYFCIFRGGLSENTENWTIACQIINGFVIAALTCTNIWVFYKLTLSIENKNEKRILKSKIFEEQSIITQMRIKSYERISTIINERKVELLKHEFNMSNYETLKKELVSINDSFLFKGGNLEMGSYLLPSSNDILSEINKLYSISHRTQYLSDDNIKPLYSSLDNFINIMEIYVLGQIITDNDVTEYVKNNNADCTMKCIVQFLDTAKQKLETSTEKENGL